jgi:hypothetical protein
MSELPRSPSDDGYMRAQRLYPGKWVAWRGDEIIAAADGPRGLKHMLQEQGLETGSVVFGFIEPADAVCVY